ncbi:MAG: hypothetical protein KDK36_17575 [Leptospiraceae bacterium]|nr:hypothetical protein [Leptospiraceae bacterium]
MKNLKFKIIILLILTFLNCGKQISKSCKTNSIIPFSYGNSNYQNANSSSVSTSPSTSTNDGSSEEEFVKIDNSATLTNPGKIYLKGNLLYINDIRKGVHIYNNSNPSNPSKKVFISIPGNVEIAIKDNIIFANSIKGLLAIKVYDDYTKVEITANFSKILTQYGFFNVSVGMNDWVGMGSDAIGYGETYSGLVKVGENCNNYEIIPLITGSYYSDNSTTTSSSSGSTGSSGQGGSLSTFAIKGNFLYVLNYRNVFVLDIEKAEEPSYLNKISLNSFMETVFLFKEYLMFGANNGMYIYNIEDPQTPTYTSKYTHAFACDPVVASGNYAYVTLRAGCASNPTNQLDIIDISNISSPSLIKSYEMTSPFGLGIDNNHLFICDTTDGLKIYDVTNPNNINLLATKNDMKVYDVILNPNTSILTGPDGIIQYDYTNINEILKLSTILKE